MKLLSNRRLWFRAVLSGSLVGLLVWRVDIGEALQSFTEANYLFVLPALAVFLVFQRSYVRGIMAGSVKG